MYTFLLLLVLLIKYIGVDILIADFNRRLTVFLELNTAKGRL